MKKNYLVKRISVFLFFVFIVIGMKAQDVTLDAHEYKGGYNISCHGQTDGIIDATPTGGTAPYTFSWSNGATTEDVSGLAAGSYTLTVTDAASHSVSKSITLYEPDALSTTLTPSNYSGFNISNFGGHNGEISTYVAGGAPPYSYLWSNSDNKPDQTILTAGSYSVTVTDQNGCASTQSTTLSQPDRLEVSYSLSSHNGFNVTCAGGGDGSIDITVTGGATPYNYSWSTGDYIQDLSNQPAGVYNFTAYDNNGNELDTTITLTEPAALDLTLTKSEFANGHNTGCYGCSDGSIAATYSGSDGVGAIGGLGGGSLLSYTYSWNNGQTGQTLVNVGAGTYSLTVTDNHGCATNASAVLTDPAQNAWGKTGTSADSTTFIGTTNNAPMIFKTNGAERLRLTTAGNIGLGVASPVEKMEVAGNIKATGNIMFGGDKQISFTPASSGHPNIFSIGMPPVLTSIPSCFPALTTATQVPGFLQIVDDPTGSATASSHDLAMGWDGVNGIIDLASSSPTSALYLNQYCGKNVAICFGTNGGDIALASIGKVGIGTNSPTAKLDVVNGFTHFTFNTQTIPASDPFGGLTIGWNRSNGGAEVNFYNVFENPDPIAVPSTAFVFSQKTGTTTYNDLLTIKSSGNIGIGNSAPSYKLEVNASTSLYGIREQVQGNDTKAFVIENTAGTEQIRIMGNGVIYGREVMLMFGTFPDYVFSKDYALNSLEYVENYIKRNHHLPNMPSAKDVKENGIGTTELETKLLEKIEELTLYTIELNKRIAELENK